MGKRSIFLVAVLAFGTVTGLVGCAIHAALADEASDRKSLMLEIDSLLRDAASYLSSASSSSGPSEVEYARRKVQEVKGKLSYLERVQGDDSKAKDRVSRYPRYCEDFDRAASYFQDLKNQQRSIDELPRRCGDLDRQLVEQADRFENEKDGEQIEALRRLALDTGTKADEWMTAAEKQKDQMTRWSNDARRFSVSDEWSRVTSNLNSAAERSLEIWMKMFNEASNACKDLRQRDRHPRVEKAIAALSGTAKGKDQIYVYLDDKLKRAESAVRDLEGASDSSKAEDAQRSIAEMESLLRDLENAKGKDKKANQIVEKWPDYVKAFPSPITALKGLKDAQHQLDAAPGKCTDAETALQEQMARYLSDKNPDGLHEIPPIATERGDHFRKALEATDQARSTYKGLIDTINRFEPRDDRWSPLRSAMKDTASRLYEFWDRKTQEVHRACDNIAKGTRARAVEKYMSELGGKSQSDLKDFQDLAAGWEKDARGIYVVDCQDMQRLWNAWCGVEFERNEDPGDDEAAAERTTDDIISRESSNIDGVLDRLKPLEETAKKLVQKAKYRSTVEEIQKMLDKQKGRLQRLKKKNGDWRGNNNPALQFTKTYGQQQHDKMNDQFRCNVYDQSGYPGLGKRRPDCVVVEGKNECWIYEFKPKDAPVPNPLSEYVDKVQTYYKTNMHEGRAADSNLGGAAFQALVEANCRTNPNGDKRTDDIKFESAVQPYERCDRRYECTE